ncbi:hypothetical protein THTE_1857 [Thermogutta terrifontis]|uniref:Uncharacterized protein n=1 Tax=Thermogutta terrifontis TaxID=1331910 RepID=A0A286RER0_9BACT|nr:hypothetical protein THTE_1857 [Thermogutta terrifontis]
MQGRFEVDTAGTADCDWRRARKILFLAMAVPHYLGFQGYWHTGFVTYYNNLSPRGSFAQLTWRIA